VILADFCCPVHGPFEALTDAAAEMAPCPSTVGTFLEACGALSPWMPSPIRGRVKLGEVSRGKSDPKPGPTALDYSELAEGMPMAEFRAKRKRLWRDHDYKQRKAKG
jgi:hypothetical protein